MWKILLIFFLSNCMADKISWQFGGRLLLQETSSEVPELKVSYRVGPTKTNSQNETVATVLISLKAQESRIRIPLSLSLTVDQSDSLDAQGLNQIIQRTLNLTGGALNETDFAALSSFSSQAQEQFALSRFVNDTQRVFFDTVDNLQLDGSTNLAEGLRIGLEQQQNLEVQQQIVQGLFLFSDGQTNVGQVDIEEIKQQIRDLTGGSNRPVIIYTIGFGEEVETDLLEAIGDTGSGGMILVEKVEDVERAFGIALGSLLQSYFDNVKVDLSGVDVQNVTTSGLGEVDPSRTKISFPNLQGSERRDLIVDIKVSDPQGSNTTSDVIKVNFSYGNQVVSGNNTRGSEFEIKVNETTASPDQDEDPVIQVNKIRFQTASTLLETEDLVKNGDFVGAQTKLNSGLEEVRELKTGGVQQILQSSAQPSFDVDSPTTSRRRLRQIIEDDIEESLALVDALELAYLDAIQIVSQIEQNGELQFLFGIIVDVGNTLQDQRLQVLSLNEFESSRVVFDLFSSSIQRQLQNFDTSGLQGLPSEIPTVDPIAADPIVSDPIVDGPIVVGPVVVDTESESGDISPEPSLSPPSILSPSPPIPPSLEMASPPPPSLQNATNFINDRLEFRVNEFLNRTGTPFYIAAMSLTSSNTGSNTVLNRIDQVNQTVQTILKSDQLDISVQDASAQSGIVSSQGNVSDTVSVTPLEVTYSVAVSENGTSIAGIRSTYEVIDNSTIGVDMYTANTIAVNEYGESVSGQQLLIESIVDGSNVTVDSDVVKSFAVGYNLSSSGSEVTIKAIDNSSVSLLQNSTQTVSDSLYGPSQAGISGQIGSVNVSDFDIQSDSFNNTAFGLVGNAYAGANNTVGEVVASDMYIVNNVENNIASTSLNNSYAGITNQIGDLNQSHVEISGESKNNKAYSSFGDEAYSGVVDFIGNVNGGSLSINESSSNNGAQTGAKNPLSNAQYLSQNFSAFDTQTESVNGRVVSGVQLVTQDLSDTNVTVQQSSRDNYGYSYTNATVVSGVLQAFGTLDNTSLTVTDETIGNSGQSNGGAQLAGIEVYAQAINNSSTVSLDTYASNNQARAKGTSIGGIAQSIGSIQNNSFVLLQSESKNNIADTNQAALSGIGTVVDTVQESYLSGNFTSEGNYAYGNIGLNSGVVVKVGTIADNSTVALNSMAINNSVVDGVGGSTQYDAFSGILVKVDSVNNGSDLPSYSLATDNFANISDVAAFSGVGNEIADVSGVPIEYSTVQLQSIAQNNSAYSFREVNAYSFREVNASSFPKVEQLVNAISGVQNTFGDVVNSNVSLENQASQNVAFAAGNALSGINNFFGRLYGSYLGVESTSDSNIVNYDAIRQLSGNSGIVNSFDGVSNGSFVNLTSNLTNNVGFTSGVRNQVNTVGVQDSTLYAYNIATNNTGSLSGVSNSFGQVTNSQIEVENIAANNTGDLSGVLNNFISVGQGSNVTVNSTAYNNDGVISGVQNNPTQISNSTVLLFNNAQNNTASSTKEDAVAGVRNEVDTIFGSIVTIDNVAQGNNATSTFNAIAGTRTNINNVVESDVAVNNFAYNNTATSVNGDAVGGSFTTIGPGISPSAYSAGVDDFTLYFGNAGSGGSYQADARGTPNTNYGFASVQNYGSNITVTDTVGYNTAYSQNGDAIIGSKILVGIPYPTSP